MRIFVVLISLVSLTMFAGYSGADTIKLKSGRTIKATKCWEDGDIIKCKLYGQVVGYHKDDIDEMQIDAEPEMPADGFLFDIWQSGISVRQTIDIAEANDIPFHKGGLISVNKTFNPKMCRPYEDTATEFYYKAQILGKWATLTFKFTPSSKRLYSLIVAFSGPGTSNQSEFRQQIESMLREKYGNPIQVRNQILFADYDWKINNNAMVTIRPTGAGIQIIYHDLRLTQLAEKEKIGQVRSGFNKSEKSKF